MMTNVNATNNYITTPDRPDLRLTGDFTLKFGLRDVTGAPPYMTLFNKGIPGGNLAGSIFIYQGQQLFMTSDGGPQYDIFNALTLPFVNGLLDLTLVRNGPMLSVYAGTTLVTSVNIGSKTFGNNTSPLNINGGNLQYTLGLACKLDHWVLINGRAVVPT